MDRETQGNGIWVNKNKLYTFVYQTGKKFTNFVLSFPEGILDRENGIEFILDELENQSNIFKFETEISKVEIATQLLYFYMNLDNENNPMNLLISDLANKN